MASQENEMLELIKITSLSIKNYSNDSDLKQHVYRALDEDILRITTLNKEIITDQIDSKNFSPHNFQSNKLFDLLIQSKKYINAHWSSIVEGDSDALLRRPDGRSWYGTSILNYMQTSMLETLSVIFETPVSQLECLKEVNIYQLAESPNIQSTCVSNVNASDQSKIKKLEIMKGWRWSTADKTSKLNESKLVVPSLGFSFGGTRFDEEFINKVYKLHDATSFVGEYLNFNKLTTLLLNEIVAPSLNYVNDFHVQLGVDGLKHIMQWKKNIVLPQPGQIFLIKAYCGFVIEVDYEKKCINTLGFNRLMPFIEGFVKTTYILNSDGKWNRQIERNFLDEFSDLIDINSTNVSLLLTAPNEMYFFEIITDI